MTIDAATLNDIKNLVAQLTGEVVHEVISASHGGNSRVYRVVTADKCYALKQYPSREHDPRDRLHNERMALELMHWHGIHNVPYWIAAAPPYALMLWIEGEIIATPKEEDINELAIFLATLHHISRKTPHQDMALASEACLSGQIIIDQLEQRMATLMQHSKENPALLAFLSKEFMPAFVARLKQAKAAMSDFATSLPIDQQTLIAADFGFHNVMRKACGALCFIDFEYFGWDDPCKLMADFLLHPATKLSDKMKSTFYQHMLGVYGASLATRFAAYFPLYGLRWTLILLNLFIPEYWQARSAMREDADWQHAKTEQLAKAQKMLAGSAVFTMF